MCDGLDGTSSRRGEKDRGDGKKGKGGKKARHPDEEKEEAKGKEEDKEKEEEKKRREGKEEAKEEARVQYVYVLVEGTQFVVVETHVPEWAPDGTDAEVTKRDKEDIANREAAMPR